MNSNEPENVDDPLDELPSERMYLTPIPSYTFNIQPSNELPPLNLPPQHPHDDEEQQEANRYTTTVSVEVSVDDQIRVVKWFADLQLAYLWTVDQLALYHNIDWTVRSFDIVSTTMDRRWQEGRRNGCAIIYSDRIEYRAYYEPSVDRALITSRNQPSSRSYIRSTNQSP